MEDVKSNRRTAAALQASHGHVRCLGHASTEINQK